MSQQSKNAEYHYAEYKNRANMLNIVMLNAIIPSVIFPNATMLSVIDMTLAILNVVKVTAVASDSPLVY
jgi:hypothetical protein